MVSELEAPEEHPGLGNGHYDMATRTGMIT